MSNDLPSDALLLLDKCSSVGCERTSTKKCAGCRFARYCSPGCQKRDWKLQHKQACPTLSTIHLLLPPSNGSPSFRVLQVGPKSTPLHVIETGTTDTLHLRGINPSDRHPFPGSLPNLAVLLPKLNPPIQDGSLHHVIFENIFTPIPRDRELMDPLFRFLRDQLSLQTVQILFTHPLESYNLGSSDVPELYRNIWETDHPSKAWKQPVTPGMIKEEGFVPGMCLNVLVTGFLIPLVSWIGKKDPVSFPELQRIAFRVRDEVFLEALLDVWNSMGGENEKRPGKIAVLESEEDAAAMERFRRIVWVDGL